MSLRGCRQWMAALIVLAVSSGCSTPNRRDYDEDAAGSDVRPSSGSDAPGPGSGGASGAAGVDAPTQGGTSGTGGAGPVVDAPGATPASDGGVCDPGSG